MRKHLMLPHIFRVKNRLLLSENYIEFPIPTNTTDSMITAIPVVNVHFVLVETPFHSFRTIPHMLAVRIIVDMCRIHELAPLPSLLSPIP